ncbi:MAG: MafI family immunity protein [Cellulomonadaceae bacterium]|nr:MafI family immunity protein [Cellulomonadaceae bacterium]
MMGEVMDSDSLVGDLKRALDGAAGLPVGDSASIGVLIDVGEWQVALETLCIQMYEHDVEVGEDQRSLLGRLGRVLGVPVGYLLGDPWA